MQESKPDDPVGRATHRAFVPGDAAPSLAAKLIIVVNFWRRAGNAYYQALFGLSITEVHVLRLLEAHAPQPLTTISEQCGIDKTQMSRAVKRLVQRGFVTHNKSARNGRERGLSLGPEGIAIRRELKHAADRRHDMLVAGLSSAQIDTLDETLDVLLRNAKSAGERQP